MKSLTAFFLGLCLTGFMVGCGDAEGDGHVSDKTPGGEPTTPMEDLMTEEAMDEYEKTQGGIVGGDADKKKGGSTK